MAGTLVRLSPAGQAGALERGGISRQRACLDKVAALSRKVSEMTSIERRGLLRTSATALAAALAANPVLAQPAASETKSPAAPPPGAAPKGPPPVPVTHILARYAATAPIEQIPDAVRKEATRTLLNWVGCAVGGSQEGAPRHAVAALQPFSGPAQASLFGRKERLDVPRAALVNGISSHVLDYDDTHLKTIIHPAGPVASEVLAWAEYRPVSGAELMNALVLGCEIECRMGNAVFPEHYAMGWHITGSTGVFGAAAAIGRLLRLDEQHMAWALGLAASQPVGLKVQFGWTRKASTPVARRKTAWYRRCSPSKASRRRTLRSRALTAGGRRSARGTTGRR
jgi:MmgE/PrpD N-terminal domain